MGCMCGRKKTKAGDDVEDDFDVIDTSHPDSAKKAMASSEKTPSKRGLSRLFSSKKSVPQPQPEEKSSTSEEEAEEMQDDFPTTGPPPTLSKKGPGDFRPSQIESRVTERTIETDTSGVSSHVRTGRKQDPATAPPPARESAFHGPPRFDWIDIVSIFERRVQRTRLAVQSYSRKAFLRHLLPGIYCCSKDSSTS